MSLKKNIVHLMSKSKITIRELSQKTGVSEPTLKRLRSGNSNPTLDVLMKLSTALNTPIASLLGNQEDGYPLIKQDEININEITTDLFILSFTENMYDIANGAKAIFKRYRFDDNITKYIINNSNNILELYDKRKLLFRNIENDIFNLDKNDIFAVIVKQIFEVNYV